MNTLLSDDDWELVEKAVLLARDTAFLTTNDKNSEPVKLWDRLKRKVSKARVDEYHERKS